MSIIKDLFTDKFRPKSLDMLIAPQRVKDELSKGLVQNVLLHGSAGTGKTSTAWILANGHSTKYINASTERGIDTVREDISRFCSSMSLMDGSEQLKCIILDEIDNATGDFFMALRATMEKYSKVARFIATCNYIEKIPDPVLSRFHKIAYDPITNAEESYLIKEYKIRVALIFDKIGIKYTDPILEKFILGNFPDMRDIMNKLQSFYLREISELTEDNFHGQFDFMSLFELCVSKPDKPYNNYKFVTDQYSSKVDDALLVLGSEFPNYIKTKHPHLEAKLPLILIAVADYQYQKAFTIDPMISLLAAIFKIQQICN
jgi:replication factor C small subunit